MEGLVRTELRDGALVLRPWRLDDVPRVTEICADPEISRWTRVPFPYAEEHARIWIEQTIRDWDDRRQAAFAVTDAATGEVVGAIGLRLYEDYALQASIGYWVAKEARGRGVATGALRLVSRWALRELGLPRVQLVTDPENVPSQVVAERAGFRREGLLRSYIELQERRRDCLMFSLLADELEDENRGYKDRS
ncbi:MAG TPA: GNAT family N-acetyltransferase [Gaiellaceae bacterium]|nr:GNAT family N-acetyltransferase [Gaiellaceae bacterium]